MAYSWFESFTSVNFSLDALLELHQDVCVRGCLWPHGWQNTRRKVIVKNQSWETAFNWRNSLYQLGHKWSYIFLKWFQWHWLPKSTCQIKAREVHCLPHLPLAQARPSPWIVQPPWGFPPAQWPILPPNASWREPGIWLVLEEPCFQCVVPACHNTAVESCKFNKQGLSYQNKAGDKRVDWFLWKIKSKDCLIYL